MTLSPKNDCLIWRRASDGRYGQISVRGRLMKAHRFAWQLSYGDIPVRMQVLHHCDNPLCVLPAHLFLGTQADNMRDMSAKGRNAMQRHPEKSSLHRVRVELRGEKHGRAKLSDSQVAEIRALAKSGISSRRLGRLFGVSGGHAWKIANGIQRIDKAPGR